VGRSVPSAPRWTPDTVPAERSLWRWAVGQLDARVLVLPQVSMTIGGGGRVEEAEADLVLIDPAHGVTVVEVKGGTVSYDAARATWRRREGASREIRDPVAQAKRARSVLRRALAAAGVTTATVALRWAVATPECRLEAPGEPVLGAEQLWDAVVADQLALRYRRTCGALASGEQPLGEAGAERIAAVLRGRDRAGRPTLAAAVDEHEARVRIHTESHRNVLRHFASHPHVLVRGAAGTGKTVLALEAAAQYASLGQRVLLVCWNVVLSHWLRAALRDELAAIGSPVAEQVTADPTGQVVVTHVADLAARAPAAAAAPDPPVDPARFYHETLPGLLTPAVTAGEFDVVVLDEAQDLSELWVLAVAGLVARKGRWYAFADGQQDLFDADAALPEFLEVEHELTENFRNSRAIAAFAAGFGAVELDCVAGDGPDVRVVTAPSDRVVARTREVARQLQREERIADGQLAVLWLFHNPRRGENEAVAQEVLSGGPVATNSASFKGMERPVVVLGLDIDPSRGDRRDELRRAIYAAATRARSLLVVVGDPEAAAAVGLDGLADQLRDGAPAAGGAAAASGPSGPADG
jgi:Mrp family chromosome partitioning ATPase